MSTVHPRYVMSDSISLQPCSSLNEHYAKNNPHFSNPLTICVNDSHRS
ncbi:hypothetical protein SAMN05421788_103359 [Filimonas lacunae]|uniref:Uncharacterized protein n=1 Tax=Filimonas lacunae TaxID=477680 RepID=A0A1N7PBZ7_9BACT|nr:hypothetical protein SAMN05421788_103359 [Filimonas lacunae]